MFTVLLYYHYTAVEDPEALRDQQRELCASLEIQGRILVSTQGINGTVAGSETACLEYMRQTNAIVGFESMEWKKSSSPTAPFSKLKVKVRPELVTLQKQVDLDRAADYIEPEEFARILSGEEEAVVLDMRNLYEYEVGHFKGAVPVAMNTFKELPQAVKELAQYKNQPVVTYCTGGIRCETASAYLKQSGFTNVRQLHGGVARYADITGGKDFEGELYVFDGRVTTNINSINPCTISCCHHCHQDSSRYINCSNAKCNLQMICCQECDEKFDGGCSKKCQSHSRYKPNELSASA